MQETFDYVTQQYKKQVDDLKELIKKVEAQNAPRCFVQNRKSGKTHKALTYYADVGPEALAYCGYKYGRSSVRMLRSLDGIPPELMCGTCLSEFRVARR